MEHHSRVSDGRFRSRPVRLALSVLAAAPLLVLAACSSSGDAPAADGLTPLTFQASWVNDSEFIGYFIGMDKGYYKDEGVSLKYVSGGSSVIPESVLLADKADIILSSPDTTVDAITKQGADFVIIGTEYQKNPIGVVSLASSHISSPADLVGKTVAVPDANRLGFSALLKINHVKESDVKVVPYSSDPTPLVKGEVDAVVDFVTNAPEAIKKLGAQPSSFTFYDFGYKIPNDTIVVNRSELKTNRAALVGWLRASIKGWKDNSVDTTVYPAKFMTTWFKGNGSTLESEKAFNAAQQPLIDAGGGVFEMSDESISETISSLALVGIKATPDMFDMSLYKDIDQ